MRHAVAGRKFSRPTDHRLAMYRNMMSSLIRYEKIVTTEAKAKEIRGMVERLITLGKRGDLHARRQAQAKLYDTSLVDKLIHVIAPRFAERAGGYTRMVKMGPRRGDAAPLALVELVD
ncbi:MAG: 50S ribosomal protein L17 [Chloroflexota bacterium]